MADSRNSVPVKVAKTSTTGSATAKSSNPSAAKTVSLATSNPRAYLHKLFGGDEKKVNAGLRIRSWLKIALLHRRERALSAQLSSLQSQHDLILTNPQHFQDVDIEQLIGLAPLAFGSSSNSTDPYRKMTEATDALLRSEMRRHTTFSTTLAKSDQQEDINAQIKTIDLGRREILHTYAQRVHLMSGKRTASPTLPQAAEAKQSENLENKTAVLVQEKKPKLKKSASIRWADGVGEPLIQSQVFDMDAVVTPSSSTLVQV